MGRLSCRLYRQWPGSSQPDAQVAPPLEQARTSIASLTAEAIDELVRDHVRQLRGVGARQQRLENLLVGAYRALPQTNQLDSIPGIGAVSAAFLGQAWLLHPQPLYYR